MVRRHLLVVALLTAVAPCLVAADEFVECVQRQLLEAEIDVGSADGRLGPNTRRGLEQLRERHQSLKSLPDFSIENASVFCRAIGIERNSQTGWTSKAGFIHLIAGANTSLSDTRNMEEIVRDVSRFYLENLQVSIPGRIALVVSESVDEAARLASETLRANGVYHNIGKGFVDWCRGYQYCGVSYGSVVAVSYKNKPSFPEFKIRELVAHEIAHEIQAQYVGNFHGNSDQQQLQQRGPVWLTEAAAIVLAAHFKHPNLEAKYQLKKFDGRQTYDAQRLKELWAKRAARESDFVDYSSHAGFLLASLSSHSAFISFWEKTPGLGWEKAFEEAFGLSLSEFYSVFGS